MHRFTLENFLLWFNRSVQYSSPVNGYTQFNGSLGWGGGGGGGGGGGEFYYLRRLWGEGKIHQFGGPCADPSPWINAYSNHKIIPVPSAA